MSRDVGGSNTDGLVGRSIGFGALSGAALGAAGWALLTIFPWNLAAFIAYSVLDLVAAVVGAVVGVFVGLLCAGALIADGCIGTGARRRVRAVAGVAAGTPFVALGSWQSLSWGSSRWDLGGWLWWFVIAAMAAATGAAIGPHVVGGRVDPLAPGHSCLLHCRLTRSARPA